MKKILLLSDTHGFWDAKLDSYAEKCDEIWHGGDWGPEVLGKMAAHNKVIRGVYGNIDGAEIRGEFRKNLVFTCEGLKVYMTHIGGYPGRYAQEARRIIVQEKPGLFISGHSHILKVMRDIPLQMMHMNPGAAGIHGFHKVRTWLTFEVHGSEMKSLNVVECAKFVGRDI